MKNFLAEKKQKTANPLPEQSEENAPKKKAEGQTKVEKHDDENWDNENYPQFQSVILKNIGEIKQKKQETTKGHMAGGWDQDITKNTGEENEEVEKKVEEQPMKAVKAPEKKTKQSFADQIRKKNEQKKKQVAITEEEFPEFDPNAQKPAPKPKEEVKPASVVEEKKGNAGPPRFMNKKKADEGPVQKPIETVAVTQPVEKKPEPKPDIRMSEGPRKFVSKKKDDKDQAHEKSQADLRKEEAERRIEERLREEEEKKKRVLKPGGNPEPKTETKEIKEVKEVEKPVEKPSSEEKAPEERKIKFVNKKANNINNNVPLAQNLNSENKEEESENKVEEEGQVDEDGFKVVEKKKHEPHNEKKEGKPKKPRVKSEKEKENKKDGKPQKENPEAVEKPVENIEVDGPKETKPNEKKDEIPKVVHCFAVASSWD